MVRSIFMLAEARGDSLQRATEGRELQKRTWQLHVSKAVYAMLHSTLLTGLMDNSIKPIPSAAAANSLETGFVSPTNRPS